MTGMAQNAPTVFINQAANYWVLQFTDQAIKMEPLPLIFSISYGWSELQQCEIAVANCDALGYTSQQYIDKTNTNFQIMGSMGVTVLVADGDDGASSYFTSTGFNIQNITQYCPIGGCYKNSTLCGDFILTNSTTGVTCVYPSGYYSTACQTGFNPELLILAINEYTTVYYSPPCNIFLDEDLSEVIHLSTTCTCDKMPVVNYFGILVSGFKPQTGPLFVPDYPASSPYVTSVGASQLLVNAQDQITNEVAASIETGSHITTGGGFSTFQQQVLTISISY